MEKIQILDKHPGSATLSTMYSTVLHYYMCSSCTKIFGPTSCLAMNLDTWVAYSISMVLVLWIRIGLNPDPDQAFYLSADADPWSQTNVDSVGSWSVLSS
jgi:hypothetical protein